MIRFLSGILILTIFVSSCGNSTESKHDDHNHQTIEIQEDSVSFTDDHHHVDAIYGCPVHKELIGSKGDKCPKCNYMEMVPVTWSLEGLDTVRVTSLPDYNPNK